MLQLCAAALGCVCRIVISAVLYAHKHGALEQNTAVCDHKHLLSLLQEPETESKPGDESSSGFPQSPAPGVSVAAHEDR